MENKLFYSGGFLFNLKNKKILLHLRDKNTKINPNFWAFFGGLSKEKEKPVETFIREFNEETEILLKKDSIKLLRKYFNPDYNTVRYVFVAESLRVNKITLKEGESFNWFNLKDVFNLNLSKRTREDLEYFEKLI